LPRKLQELIGNLLGDEGGAMIGALVLVGDKLGFYRSLAEPVPLSADESRGAHRSSRRNFRTAHLLGPTALWSKGNGKKAPIS
jgi:hypothetical protein